MNDKGKIAAGLVMLCVLTGCSGSIGKKQPIESSTATSKTEQTTAVTKDQQSAVSSSTAEQTSQSEQTTATKQVLQLSETQKQTISQAFLEWAGQRAVMGNMAVSDWFFDHGAAGQGDWYADSPDGQIQVQDNQHPGTAAFAIHAIGGVVFYTAKNGATGIQDLFADSFASNYSVKMDSSKPVSKYLLGDNGVVYELKTGNGVMVTTNTGFGEYADDGTIGNYVPDQAFQVSEDQAAQNELAKLLQPYR